MPNATVVPEFLCPICDGTEEVIRDCDGDTVPCACQYDLPVCPLCEGAPQVTVVRGDVEERTSCWSCLGSGMARRAS